MQTSTREELLERAKALKGVVDDARLSLAFGQINDAKKFIDEAEKRIAKLASEVLARQRALAARNGAGGFTYKQLYGRRG